MTDIEIWHNPRCSKSRAALEILTAKGLAPRIVAYLESPPTAERLDQVLEMLGIEPRELMRKGESPYRELGLDDASLDREALIHALAKHPILIERPIVIANGRAVIGRPPERVLDVL
jgi:arsenate reductase (glutaredoxin)